jgi:hypothetical protein
MTYAKSRTASKAPRETRSRAISNVMRKGGSSGRPALARERMAAGDLAMARREPQVATAEYGHALALSESGDPSAVAELHARLGHAHRLLGDGEARDHYERAIMLDKGQLPAIRCLIEDHAEHGDWDLVARLEEQLFRAVDDPTHRSVEMVASGDRWLAEADAPVHARMRYLRALACDRASGSAARRLSSLRASK